MESDPRFATWRFELLPFGSAIAAAAASNGRLSLTVTCSPKHGPDQTVQVARKLRAHGHSVIVHLAARMVQGPRHLDILLAALAETGIEDVFVVGGDLSDPAGPYRSSLDLLHAIRDRTNLRSIGVGAYPEGHPLIEDGVLIEDLRLKAGLADYAVTQMCFDPAAVVTWLRQLRARGMQLPVYVGLPGAVDRKRLLEISLRVGVCTSVSFPRKQRPSRRLLGRGRGAAAQLFGEIAPLLDADVGVSGLHFFTFNRLLETLDFVQRQRVQPHDVYRPAGSRSAANAQEPETA